MFRKEPNTDAAWCALYSRLQNENLLNEETVQIKQRKRIIPVYWAAACIIALLGTTIFFLYNSDKKSAELLTLQNTENENILVKTLDDGSTVYLTSNASVSYPKSFSGNKREISLKGEALFDVAKNPSKPFLIETEKVTVKVLGTAFKVKSSSDGNFELVVQRGRVRVTEKVNGNSIVVTAGQSVSFIDNHLFKYSNKDSNIFNRYTSKMRFKDETLENIVHVINQNNDSFVVLKGGLLKASRLNVQFYKNNVNEMTQIISLALNLKREIRQDTIFISQP
jgi:ferric-dicitrate binding protein FerR (iron transport regulator)